MGVDQRRERPPWVLDPMSSTHNESRLAACPLSGVPERFRAPCQLILRQIGICAGLQASGPNDTIICSPDLMNKTVPASRPSSIGFPAASPALETFGLKFSSG